MSFVFYFVFRCPLILLPLPPCLPLLLQQAANSSRAAGPGAAESPETPTATPPADGGGTPQGPGTSPASPARPATLQKRVSAFAVFTRIRFFFPYFVGFSVFSCCFFAFLLSCFYSCLGPVICSDVTCDTYSSFNLLCVVFRFSCCI